MTVALRYGIRAAPLRRPSPPPRPPPPLPLCRRPPPPAAVVVARPSARQLRASAAPARRAHAPATRHAYAAPLLLKRNVNVRQRTIMRTVHEVLYKAARLWCCRQRAALVVANGAVQRHDGLSLRKMPRRQRADSSKARARREYWRALQVTRGYSAYSRQRRGWWRGQADSRSQWAGYQRNGVTSRCGHAICSTRYARARRSTRRHAKEGFALPDGMRAQEAEVEAALVTAVTAPRDTANA